MYIFLSSWEIHSNEVSAPDPFVRLVLYGYSRIYASQQSTERDLSEGIALGERIVIERKRGGSGFGRYIGRHSNVRGRPGSAC